MGRLILGWLIFIIILPIVYCKVMVILTQNVVISVAHFLCVYKMLFSQLHTSQLYTKCCFLSCTLLNCIQNVVFSVAHLSCVYKMLSQLHTFHVSTKCYLS